MLKLRILKGEDIFEANGEITTIYNPETIPFINEKIFFDEKTYIATDVCTCFHEDETIAEISVMECD